MNCDEMKVKAVAPWFGSKRMLAKTIIQELGKHRAYYEPFCGSIAVLLSKAKVSLETVNDLHGDLTNLAKVIASDNAYVLYEKLSRVLFCEGLYLEAISHTQSDIDYTTDYNPRELSTRHIERAYWYFIKSWVGRNGVSGTARNNYQIAVRWTPGGGGGGSRFISAVESIPVWHQRLRNAVILNRDAFEIIPKIDDHPDVAIYVDPPYLANTRGHCKYEYDFECQSGGMFGDDHDRLADLLSRFKKARIVISYYEDPRIRDLYRQGWNIYSHTRQKNLHVQNRRGMGKCEAPEILIINGASYVTNTQYTFLQP